MYEIVRRVWNGGLRDDCADTEELRERRTVSATFLLLAIVSLLLAVSLVILDAKHGQQRMPETIWRILLSVVCVFVMMLVQAMTPRRLPLAHLGLGAYYVVSSLSMMDDDIWGSAWTWHLGMPVLATLLTGRAGGLAWTGVSLGTLWWHGVTQIDTGPETLRFAGEVRLVASSLLIMFMTVAAQAFRTAQITAQASLKLAVGELLAEVVTRRAAEATARSSAATANAASEAKARFLATMSHEIRTPMNGVLGAAQLLRQTNLTSEQSDLLNTVHASGEVLLGIINDVLDYSQLESGQVQIERLPVELRSVLEGAVAPLVLRARDKKVDFGVHIDADLPGWVEGDPNRLRQIVLNLAGNALKFTETGSVGVHALLLGDYWRLEVKDTGIGMDPGTIHKLFSPFVQGEVSTRRRFGGSGLGLTIVRHLVLAMNGRHGVESQLGEGSLFWVELPLNVAQPPDGQLSPHMAVTAVPRRILVVDDNPVNRKVAVRMLKRDGHIVTEAENGRLALERMREDRFDVVFMDVQMPEMDGYEATQALRALSEGPCTPVVGLTANALPGDREKVLASGMNDYLAKPVRSEDLRAAVMRWTSG
ncbi:MAG: response regulator [Myxococcota bacterium]